MPFVRQPWGADCQIESCSVCLCHSCGQYRYENHDNCQNPIESEPAMPELSSTPTQAEQLAELRRQLFDQMLPDTPLDMTAVGSMVAAPAPPVWAFCDCGYEAPTRDAWSAHQSGECDECGTFYCPSLGECPGDHDDYYERDGYSNNGIYSYSYRPRLRYHGGRGAPYYLGIELEISADYGMGAEPIYQWARENSCPNFFYVKSDSSVSGFEIVTHPMTPQYFESFAWENFFDMLNETYPLARRNGEENVGHGIHVHVSRTAFPNLIALARWNFLMNKTAYPIVERVARRSNSTWGRVVARPVRHAMASWAELHGGPSYWNWESNRGERRGTWTDEMHPCPCGCDENYVNRIFVPETRSDVRRSFSRETVYCERYEVVNMTNRATCEVRAFRSTRSPDEFRNVLRSVYTTVDYVRSLTGTRRRELVGVGHTMGSLAGYAQFVAANPPDESYNALVSSFVSNNNNGDN